MTREPKAQYHRLCRLAATLLAFSLLTGSASAVTWTVCASGCDYSSIQGAVAAASSGDTLSLSPETFVEGDIFLDKDLTIATSSGFAVVDGNGGDYVFEIDEEAIVVLEDLQLKNADHALVGNHGVLLLSTVHVLGYGNTTVYGGLVNFWTGFLRLQDASLVAGNRSTSFGGGITNFGDLEVSASTLMANQGRRGGAILNLGGEVVVTSSSLSLNQADVRGGAYSNSQGGTVFVTATASYSGNTASVACDRYHDIHRTPSCVD